MSAFAVSMILLACCGLVIVAGALLRMYGAERRRLRREGSSARPLPDSAPASPRPRG